MSEQSGVPAPQQTSEIGLLDVLLLLARNLRWLIIVPTLAGILALVVPIFWIPFSATAKALLPPGGGAPTDAYVTLLKSETLIHRVVRRFRLKEVYGAQTDRDAGLALASRTKIVPGRAITVSVTDRDPRLAADLANGYIDELRELARTLAISETTQRRLLYEQYIKQITVDLRQARQQRSPNPNARPGADTPVRADHQTLANLRARITAQEIRLTTLRGFATESDLRLANRELAGLREQFSLMNDKGKREQANRPQKGAPEEASSSADTQYLEALLELVVKQYEFAKADEANTELQLLDPATPSDRMSTKPVIVLATMLATLVLTILALFLVESWRHKAANADAARKLALIRESLGFRR